MLHRKLLPEKHLQFEVEKRGEIFNFLSEILAVFTTFLQKTCCFGGLKQVLDSDR
jgi:hypothetical protein